MSRECGDRLQLLRIFTGILLCLCACGARSELLTDDGAGGSTSTGVGIPLELCREVEYAACTPVGDAPTVVARGEVTRPDVAWYPGLGFLVAHDDSDRSRVEAVTIEGSAVWSAEVGEGRGPRLAVHPTRRRAAIVTDTGYGWVDAAGGVAYRIDSPFASERFNGNLAAFDEGFVAALGPVSDPGGNATSVSLRLPLVEGQVEEERYHPDKPTPRIDRSLKADFLLDRIGFETNTSGGLGLATFRWEEGLVLDASAFRGSSTSFVDGFYTEDEDAFFIFGGTVGFAVSQLRPDGTFTDDAVLVGQELAGFSAERLGDRRGLQDVVLALTGVMPGQTVIVRYMHRDGGPVEPILLGRGGEQSRIARYDRGVVVVWVDGDDLLLRAVDCCLD